MAEDPEGGGEKTEDASSRKLEKSREEGQVAKSIEIPSVSVLLGAILGLYASGYFVYYNVLAVLHDAFVFNSVPKLNDVEAVHILFRCTERFFLMTSPVMAAVFVVALVSNFAQVGFEVSWKAIEPKISRINPISGFKQKFSTTAIAEFVKSLLKITIVTVVAYLEVKSRMDSLVSLYDHNTAYILLYILKVIFVIYLKVLAAMAILAVFDYAFQKWKFLQDQKMTKQETKDELKQTEGDPQVKARIRQLQAQAAQKRMMADIPDADVVVTNPTHLAVALKYDGMTMDSPQVVAKGAGPVAVNIKRIAAESDVPVIENKELARNLYKMVDIGGEIPTELFQAVAEILAYVYKLKRKGV